MQTPSVDLLTPVGITILLTALIALGAFTARADDWLWPLSASRKASYAPEITHFTGVRGARRVWKSTNIFLAIAMANAWRQWNSLFLRRFVIMLVVSVQMMNSSGDNPSKACPFRVQPVLLTAAGLAGVSMAIAYTITVMYFLTRRRGWTVRVLLRDRAHRLPAIRTLQPPYQVWGDIHTDAWKQWAGGTAGVWLLCLVHTYVLR